MKFSNLFFEPEKDKRGVKRTSVLYGFYFIILLFILFIILVKSSCARYVLAMGKKIVIKAAFVSTSN